MTKEQAGPRGFQIRDDEGRELPPMTFAHLVLSLSTSAMVHLGVEATPSSAGASQRNLPLARQTIDILEMLQAKTRGNLEPDEAKLLADVLHDLHLAYVRACSG